MLRWNDIDEIVENLEEIYSDEEIPEHNLADLKEMILSLDDFEDHEIEVDDAHLKLIIEHWLEYREDIDED